MKRYALIHSTSSQLDAYMPGNYHVIHRDMDNGITVIQGEDSCGWTLDDYVLPRLASGLYSGEEIDLSHPIMKTIPDSPRKNDPNRDWDLETGQPLRDSLI